MTRELLIKKTISSIEKLPDSSLKEVSDFAEFLLAKLDDTIITEGIMKLASQTEDFQFLEEEEELYTKNDLRESFK